MAWLVILLLIGLILAGVPIGFALMITAGLSMLIADISLITLSVHELS